ncbi:MAG TPA: hypothetical protein GX396_06775 [Tissierellia bacterium]|jgi:exopolysaccharide biosynthesis protein|nr:hypothetical protein [Tissierellia bacterium]
MKVFNRICCLILAVIISSSSFVYAATSSYSSKNINGVNVNYVELNMSNLDVKPIVLNANNQMASTESLESMARKVGAFAAINGTYFEAYNGTPVPWGTIIKDNKVLHISNGGSVVGITNDGKLIIDRLSFEFEGYVNGKLRAYPWRINHPSTEPEAITIFTPEYGTRVNVTSGARAIIVNGGKVSEISTTDFMVPSNGFAIVYNPSVSYLADERYEIGDEVSYKVIINTTFTETSQWDNVVTAIGAGPSLIINGVITANGAEEGFFEDKINTQKAGRSFIGARKDGTIIFGNMGSATIKEAAEACKQMGLINAMCLDGGGSIALYYPSANVSMAGRNINNGLAFVEILAKPSSSSVIIDNEKVLFDAYNIDNNNYFKLRDIAMALNKCNKKFNVEWNADKNAINLITDSEYVPVGGELTVQNTSYNIKASLSKSDIFVNGERAELKAYTIGNNNYFKLRDIANYIGFEVDWDGASNSIIINTR